MALIKWNNISCNRNLQKIVYFFNYTNLHFGDGGAVLRHWILRRNGTPALLLRKKRRCGAAIEGGAAKSVPEHLLVTALLNRRLAFKISAGASLLPQNQCQRTAPLGGAAGFPFWFCRISDAPALTLIEQRHPGTDFAASPSMAPLGVGFEKFALKP